MCTCQPATSALTSPSKQLGTAGRRGQLELPRHPGGRFGQEMMNLSPERCGRERMDADRDPLCSPRARSGAAWEQVVEEEEVWAAVGLEESATEEP